MCCVLNNYCINHSRVRPTFIYKHKTFELITFIFERNSLFIDIYNIVNGYIKQVQAKTID